MRDFFDCETLFVGVKRADSPSSFRKFFSIFGIVFDVSCYILCRTIEDYMNDNVDFVITNEDWDKHFDEVSKVCTLAVPFCS